jgi:hypothetical protein
MARGHLPHTESGPPALLKVEELALIEATETEELKNLHDFSRHGLVLCAIGVTHPFSLGRTTVQPKMNRNASSSLRLRSSIWAAECPSPKTRRDTSRRPVRPVKYPHLRLRELKSAIVQMALGFAQDSVRRVECIRKP